MEKDTLFLLDPDVHIVAGYPRYCPPCAMVSGYLNYYPQVRAHLQIHSVSPERPRPAIVALLGEAHQGAPVLILSEQSQVPEGVSVQENNGHRFIDDERAILRYLGKCYGGGLSLGDLLG